MRKVLVVEDDKVIFAQIARLLADLGCDSVHARSVSEATENFSLKHFSLIISELELPDAPGTNLIRVANGCPVLIMSRFASMESAVDSMRKGAVDYIAKPLEEAEFEAAVKRILANFASTTKLASAQKFPAPAGMIGECALMQSVYQRISKAGPTRSTVLIRGETGTGKELVARAIHESSDRKNEAFVAINCAAIPETLIEAELFGHEKGAFTGAASKRSGLIEAAEGGTLFLDEIGELPSEAQARLLRFIQESEIRRIGSNQSQKVDVRLVAATHRDLKKLTKEGQFRADLYYRINVVRIDLPPLQQRGSDLLEIAEHLLERAGLRHNKPGLHLLPDAVQAITSYSWPGNVRELENMIERAAIMVDGIAIDRHTLEIDMDLINLNQVHAETLTPFSDNHRTNTNHFTPSSRDRLPDPTEDLSLEDYFQRFVLENQEHMNETQLAKKLGISRKCLWERRQRFGIARNKDNDKSSRGAL